MASQSPPRQAQPSCVVLVVVYAPARLGDMLCKVLKPCGAEEGEWAADKAVIGPQKKTLRPLLTDPSALDAVGTRPLAWWLPCYRSKVGTRGVLPQLASWAFQL